MSDENQKPVPAKTALAHEKLRLSTQCPVDPKRWSSLSIQIWENNPRFVVYPNDPNASDDAKTITAAVTPIQLEGVLQMIERAARSTDKFKEIVILPFYDKEQQREIEKARISVTKDATGLVSIAITNGKALKVSFPFGFDKYFRLLHANGDAFTEAETSVPAALAFADAMKRIVTEVYVTNYNHVERARPQQNGKGNFNRGGGGGYNRGGNGGGYNRGGGGGYSNNQGGGQNRQASAPAVVDEDVEY